MKHWTLLCRISTWAVLAVAQTAVAAQLVVGQVAPLTGTDANQGRGYSAGLRLYFDQVNRAGGVGGHTFALLRKDDGGRPETAVAATKQLLAESKPIVLSGYVNGRSVAAIVSSELLQKENIALVGYRTGEITSEFAYLYSVRAGLKAEINKIADHLATVGINRIGFFFEEGAQSDELRSSIDEIANRTRAQVLVKASHPLNSTSFEKTVRAMIAAQPQAIIMIASGSVTAAFVEEYRAARGAAQLFSHSGADVEQLSKRLSDEQMQGIVIAQVTPNPYRVTSQLTKDFADSLAKAGKTEVPVSYSMMEGYIAGRVIVEAARRMGARVSRDAFLQALNSITMLDLGGYVVSFRPGSQSVPTFVELSIVTTGKIRQ